jgi:hypothetical protein
LTSVPAFWVRTSSSACGSGARPASTGESAPAGQLVAALIFPIAPTDPLTFIVVPIVAAPTAAAACVAPAWRATRIDPAAAFRTE